MAIQLNTSAALFFEGKDLVISKAYYDATDQKFHDIILSHSSYDFSEHRNDLIRDRLIVIQKIQDIFQGMVDATYSQAIRQNIGPLNHSSLQFTYVPNPGIIQQPGWFSDAVRGKPVVYIHTSVPVPVEENGQNGQNRQSQLQQVPMYGFQIPLSSQLNDVQRYYNQNTGQYYPHTLNDAMGSLIQFLFGPRQTSSYSLAATAHDPNNYPAAPTATSTQPSDEDSGFTSTPIAPTPSDNGSNHNSTNPPATNKPVDLNAIRKLVMLQNALKKTLGNKADANPLLQASLKSSSDKS